MIRVAFDVDGTLIDEQDQPRWEVVDLLRALAPFCRILVWSGGGKDYARHWVERLGLKTYVEEVCDKAQAQAEGQTVDVCFDDEEAVALASILVRV